VAVQLQLDRIAFGVDHYPMGNDKKNKVAAKAAKKQKADAKTAKKEKKKTKKTADAPAEDEDLEAILDKVILATHESTIALTQGRPLVDEARMGRRTQSHRGTGRGPTFQTRERHSDAVSQRELPMVHRR
jgi:hypothetical protein